MSGTGTANLNIDVRFSFGVAVGNLRKHASACVHVRSRACSVSVYRARFAGNLALNSHRAAISRHSAGVATLLRATLTYVITRICDHCGAHRRCLFSAYRRQHVRLIKLPSSPPQLYFVHVVRMSSLLQNGGQNFLTRESKESKRAYRSCVVCKCSMAFELLQSANHDYECS